MITYMNTRLRDFISVPKKSVQQEGGMVVLPLKEYKKLLEKAVPTYYLSGKAAEELDKLVEGGLREHRAGRTTKIASLADLD